jgi:hypothetical protein
MVRLTNRRGVAAGLVVVALGALAWAVLRPRLGPPGPRAAASSGGKGAGKSQDLPRIDLARLDAKKAPSGAGGGDIFQYGAPSTRVVVRSTPEPTAAGSGAAGAPPTPPPAAEVSPLPPPMPVMNVKYIGSVADKRGLKVAVLMTDRKEVLTGRAGDIVANRLKIVSIGLESVDVQDVGSDRVRRIPLRAN